MKPRIYKQRYRLKTPWILETAHWRMFFCTWEAAMIASGEISDALHK
jgi:hypothetical protein